MITERTFHFIRLWKVESGFSYIHFLPSTLYPPFSVKFLNFNS
jgi:hypothetical protein